MAFVFRSERKLDYPSDSIQDLTINDLEKMNQVDIDIVDKIKEQERKEKQKPNKINPPFSSSSERSSINVKYETPGPGAYNINKLYFNRHRQFSSRGNFSKNNKNEFFNFPSIRLKGVINNNPGPGQYYPNEKDLFGGKIKKINNNKLNIIRNLSKSAKDIFIKDKKDISMNNNNPNHNSINLENDFKNFIFVSSSPSVTKRKTPRYYYKNNINDKTLNSSSFVNPKDSSIIKNNEGDLLLKNKINKNSSRFSGATLDTQKSSLNTSNATYTNQRNGSSKILVPKLDNSEILKCFNSFSNTSVIDNDYKKDSLLYKIDKDEEKNNINQVVQFKYDKSKIIKSSQDHERIMLLKENSYNNNLKKKLNEFLLSQELFSQNPGPGYYDPIEPINQKYFFTKKISNQNDNPKKNKSQKKINLGPGEYKTDNNSIEYTLKEKLDKNKKNNLLFDVKKIAKSRIANEAESRERNKKLKLLSLIKNQQKLIFENNLKDISENLTLQYKKKKINKSLLFNFGSNSKRFNLIENKNPGVGQYDINTYKSIEEKNSSIIENPSYDELMKKLENKSELLERAPLNKDLLNNPGVGVYNPDIISSIKYNFEYKNQFKNQINNEKTGIKNNYEHIALKRVKEIKEKEKRLMELLGPGRYFNIINRTLSNSVDKTNPNIRPPFGVGENKYENNKQNLCPGPGQYNINSYYNWITRTYNVLFY